MSFLLPFLWFFTAPHFLLPGLSAWPKCCLPYPALHDGKPDITSWTSHHGPHSLHGLQQKRLQGAGLLVKPEGRTTSSLGLRAGQTQHTLCLARRSPRQNSGTTRRFHQHYFSCGAMRLCHGRYCLSGIVFYQKTLSFHEELRACFLKNSPELFLSKTMWPLEVA